MEYGTTSKTGSAEKKPGSGYLIRFLTFSENKDFRKIDIQ
jgi:hypothetical protein